MEIILLRDVEKLGKKGDVVNVRGGFGRNFLLPHSFAVPATPGNRTRVETEKKRSAARKAQTKEQAEKLAEALRSAALSVAVAVGEKDKLFGSVTGQDVAEALKSRGFAIDKKQIRFSEPIRTLGMHTVTVELEAGVKTTLQVEVVRKKTPAS